MVYGKYCTLFAVNQNVLGKMFALSFEVHEMSRLVLSTVCLKEHSLSHTEKTFQKVLKAQLYSQHQDSCMVGAKSLAFWDFIMGCRVRVNEVRMRRCTGVCGGVNGYCLRKYNVVPTYVFIELPLHLTTVHRLSGARKVCTTTVFELVFQDPQ